MRAFVAVDLAAPEPLRALVPRLPAHFHLTLRFFGELPEAELAGVVRSVEAAAATQAPFDLELRGVGAFPDARSPRVVWVGFGEGAGTLTALAGTLEAGLRSHGHPAESRPFRPHATLLRVRGPRDQEEARRILGEGSGIRFGAQRVASLELFESRLGPAGAEHHLRASVPLAGPT